MSPTRAGSSAIVVGGAGGIGRAVCAELLATGSHVVVLDCHPSGDAPAGAMLVDGDAIDRSSVARAVERAQAAGDLRVVVNLADKAPADVDDPGEILRSALVTTATVCESLAPLLPPDSAIVNLTSQAIHRARHDLDDLLVEPLEPGWLDRVTARVDDVWEAYYYAKRGVQLITYRLAVELAPRSVRVNAVSASLVRTALLERALEHDQARVGGLVRRIPLGRVAEPHEVAAVISFLASPAASYVTGAVYEVDGGSAAAGLHPNSRPEVNGPGRFASGVDVGRPTGPPK